MSNPQNTSPVDVRSCAEKGSDRVSCDYIDIVSGYSSDVGDEGKTGKLSEDGEAVEKNLPPQDGGRHAWTVLAAAFVIEAILWGEFPFPFEPPNPNTLLGFPQSFGVFQDYYLTHEQFKDDRRVVFIGVLASGIPDLGAPFMTYITERFPRSRTLMLWTGWPLCLGSLVAASFASTMPLLILTQGLLYGIGELIFFYPLLSMINEWWSKRMGLAYGILDCSTGFSGVPLPFLIELLLKRYGYKWTLRVLCLIAIVVTGPCLFLVRGRLPTTKTGVVPMVDWKFLRKPLFYFYSVSNILQGLGWYVPLMFLPSYVNDLDLSDQMGALLLALISGAGIISSLALGTLSDGRVPLNFLTFTSSFVVAFSVFIFWGFSRTFTFLTVMSVIYSMFGAGWEVLWARMSTSVTSSPSGVMTSFGILSCQRGTANILAGLISPKLITDNIIENEYAISRYMGLILFTGTAMTLSALTIAVWYLIPRSIREKSLPLESKDSMTSGAPKVRSRHFAIAQGSTFRSRY